MAVWRVPRRGVRRRATRLRRVVVVRMQRRVRRARRSVRRVLRRRLVAFTRLYGRVRTQQRAFQAGRSHVLLRSLDAELLLRIGADHIRNGRLRDAHAVLEQAARLNPHYQRAARLARQTEGDRRVLSGEYRRPDLDHARVVPPDAGRVLHVVGKSLPFESGYTLRTQAIVESQRAAGLDPHVTTDEMFPYAVENARQSGSELIAGTRYHRIAAVKRRAAGMDERLDTRVRLGASVVSEVQPAVLHAASDFLNAEAALCWGAHFGLPVVYEVRGFWADTWLSGDRGLGAESSDLYRGRRQRELVCMRAADAVVTLGDAMKDEIVAEGIPEPQVVVVPNAVDPQRFRPGPKPARLARSLQLDPDAVTVGYITSMTAYEGLTDLLAATSTLVRAGRRIQALLVGDGNERPALEAAAADLRVADRVRFTGQVPHESVVDFYRLIDIFVVPRIPVRVCQLVTPLKPYEAMAAGCTVVASDVTALREMVIDGKTGVLFRAGDARDLADVLDALITDTAARDRLTTNARAWVEECRSWHENAQRYVKLYRHLIGA
jgi:PEP-CTERM/exosortase A-associated glycosyltransferase